MTEVIGRQPREETQFKVVAGYSSSSDEALEGTTAREL